MTLLETKYARKENSWKWLSSIKNMRYLYSKGTGQLIKSAYNTV